MRAADPTVTFYVAADSAAAHDAIESAFDAADAPGRGAVTWGGADDGAGPIANLRGAAATCGSAEERRRATVTYRYPPFLTVTYRFLGGGSEEERRRET